MGEEICLSPTKSWLKKGADSPENKSITVKLEMRQPKDWDPSTLFFHWNNRFFDLKSTIVRYTQMRILEETHGFHWWAETSNNFWIAPEIRIKLSIIYNNIWVNYDTNVSIWPPLADRSLIQIEEKRLFPRSFGFHLYFPENIGPLFHVFP